MTQPWFLALDDPLSGKAIEVTSGGGQNKVPALSGVEGVGNTLLP